MGHQKNEYDAWDLRAFSRVSHPSDFCFDKDGANNHVVLEAGMLICVGKVDL